MSDLLFKLRAFDTPTICNALEIIDEQRRNFGYTCHNFFVVNGSSAPICGYAKTATCRSLNVSGKEIKTLKAERLLYYEYVSRGNHDRIVVMQDLDGSDRARGPFWGEFNVRIHKALGCVGVVTDGSIRDLQKLPDGILLLGMGLRPSHANIHISGFGQRVNVFGMAVSDGDLIHADEHGAVCFPEAYALEVLQRASEFIENERPIIEACKRERLSIDELKELYLRR
jgi:regulator of RNase E activity RraA